MGRVSAVFESFLNRVYYDARWWLGRTDKRNPTHITPDAVSF
jgi:hypothetical protein